MAQGENAPSGYGAADESKPEEVPNALRGAVRPFKGSWRTEKPLQDFRPPRISIGTLRILMSRERRLGKGASRRAGVGRVRRAGFLSILLAAKDLFGRSQLAFDHCADCGQSLRRGGFKP